jgi:HSP20 family protein
MSLLSPRRGNGPLAIRRGDATVQPTAISRIDPWNDVDYMDRMFDSFFRAPFSVFGRSMSPRTEAHDLNVELYESTEDLTAYIYAPGVPQNAFDISVTDDTLTIKAERKPIFEAGENVTSHTPWSTLAVGSSTFSASYDLPMLVNSAGVRASYKDGVLMIRMPKKEGTKPQQVKIEVKNG